MVIISISYAFFQSSVENNLLLLNIFTCIVMSLENFMIIDISSFIDIGQFDLVLLQVSKKIPWENILYSYQQYC